MENKTAGSFRKVRKLISVLKKCNGKAAGGSGALLPAGAAKIPALVGLMALAGLLSAGAWFAQPYVGGLIPAESLAQALMLLILIVSFVLAVKDLVTVLYTSDDLALLLPMPFTAAQIVMAKLAAAASFPAILGFIIMNSVCLGFGIRAGEGATFIIGTVLSGVLVPVTGIFAALLLVVVIFRIFGFIRNRDMTVALGGIFTLALTVGYVIASNSLQQEGAAEQAAALLQSVASLSRVFPTIFFMSRFMAEGNVASLVFSFAVSALVIALALIAVRAFYFRTALSMSNTGGGKKAVSARMLREGKKQGALKALTAYEAKSARRNPAYMVYGFAMSFIWPVLFAIPFIFGGEGGFVGEISFPFETIHALLAFTSIGITASCFACGFNNLAATAFTREGSSFVEIRALPVDMMEYYRSKRNFSLFICSLGSVLYLLILGIVCIAAGFIRISACWTILAGACVSFLLNLMFVNLMLLRNSKKPNLNWDSETGFSRKLGLVNGIIVVIGVPMFAVAMGAVLLGELFADPGIQKIILTVCAGLAVLILVLSLAVNRFAPKKAVKNLMKLE